MLIPGRTSRKHKRVRVVIFPTLMSAIFTMGLLYIMGTLFKKSGSCGKLFGRESRLVAYSKELYSTTVSGLS